RAQPRTGNGSLRLVDGVGLDAGQIGELSEKLGVAVRSEDGTKLLGVQSEAGAVALDEENKTAPLGQFAPAIALATAAAAPELLPLDFRRSRLTPIPKQRITRRAGWMIALAAA